MVGTIGSRVGRLLAHGAALALLIAWLPGASAADGTPADAAATLALREAQLQLEQALVVTERPSLLAASGFEAALAHECPGVLRGAPGGEEEFEGFPSPRVRGERARAEQQNNEVTEEVQSTLRAAAEGPDLPAYEAFRARVDTLSWSDPRIAPEVRLDASLLGFESPRPSAAVCADLQAWRASGFKAVSAGTRAYAAAAEALFRQSFKALTVPPDKLLARYEGAAAKRLHERARSLAERADRGRSPVYDALSRLERALGLPSSPEERRGPLIGKASTPAGVTVTVRGGARPRHGGCANPIEIHFASPPKKGAQFTSGGSSMGECLHRADAARASLGVGCGRFEELTLLVSARVRKVRLQLSNGRTIDSRPIFIPRRYGGPAGYYAQALRGYEPYPVALVELDAAGAPIRTVKVPARERCKPEPRPVGPEFVTLAQGSTPEGEAFEIEGTFVRFGRHSSDFSVSVNDFGKGSRSFGGSIELGGSAKPPAFALQLGVGCPPHAYWIVYGLLSPPGRSVTVRTAEGLTPLTEVAIDPKFKAAGPLEWGVFATPPSELVVRGADGAVLYREMPAKQVREETEFCEGYEEP